MNIQIKGSIIHVSGTIPYTFQNAYLIAPAPIDTMQNYSGSGLPFPNKFIAYQNTPNKFQIKSNLYETEFIYPNAYYINETLVSPTISLIVDDKVVEEKILENPLPLRTLHHRDMRFENRSHFYGSKDFMLPISTAENVMRKYKDYKTQYNIA